LVNMIAISSSIMFHKKINPSTGAVRAAPVALLFGVSRAKIN
jgi:hypothetical protein